MHVCTQAPDGTLYITSDVKALSQSCGLCLILTPFKEGRSAGGRMMPGASGLQAT